MEIRNEALEIGVCVIKTSTLIFPLASVSTETIFMPHIEALAGVVP